MKSPAAMGKVIPFRQLQILQSIDGGLVSEILVKEGDVVNPNQLLIKIDETRFVSSVKENQAQYLGLVAKAARLRAISEGKPFVPPPEVLKGDPSMFNRKRSFLRQEMMS
jgi:adhesin transport system membrane fusion protein